MALLIADLNRDITLAGVSLNNVTQTQSGGKAILTGSRVDFLEVQPAEVVQYTEKLALTDGLDYGPAYKGGRVIVCRGASFAATRGEAFDLVSAIEGACAIVSGGFGLKEFSFFTLSGSGGVAVEHFVDVRPNGLSAPANRDEIGGINGQPNGIAWGFTALMMDPTVT